MQSIPVYEAVSHYFWLQVCSIVQGSPCKEGIEQLMAWKTLIMCCFACMTLVSTNQLPRPMCLSAQLAADLGGCMEESIVHAVLQEGGSWWLRQNDTPIQPVQFMLVQCALLSGGTLLYCQQCGVFSRHTLPNQCRTSVT